MPSHSVDNERIEAEKRQRKERLAPFKAEIDEHFARMNTVYKRDTKPTMGGNDGQDGLA